MNKLFSNVGLALSLATLSMLAGCQLYFGDHSGSDGRSPGGGRDGNPPGYKCGTDRECAPGCFCENGVCAEAGFCAADKDCGTGFHCDIPRSSCVPDVAPAGLCAAAVTCNTAAPNCGVGEVPLVKDGCYVGSCKAIATCEAAPKCGAIQHEADCFGRTTDCTAVYSGFGCTKPDGTACRVGDANCTCTSFAFASCVPKAGNASSVVVAE
jgi:hypothetical protein